jgi:VWFA-related protein
LVLLAAGGLRAEVRQPAVQQQQQTPQKFQSGIELVALDVTVVDRKGKPVGGLTPADFTVTVDGAPRRVVTAQFIDQQESAVAAALAPRPGDTLSQASSAPAPGRDVVIVMDEDSLETEDGLVARRAAVSLLDGLSLADRVGINTIPRLRNNFTLTTDRIENRKALTSWVPGVYREQQGVYWIGVSEAYDIDANDQQIRDKVIARECGPSSPGRVYASCARDVVMEARQLASRLRQRGTQTLDSIRTLGRGLRQLPGPKTIVLVSGGILRPESMSSFGDVEAELAAAQITLYTLFFEKSEYSAGRYRQSPTLGEDDRIFEDGLANVTSAAGGTFLRVIGTAETYFERVATELSASYLLGIEVVATDRNGKPHRVEVKVKRPGLDVHGRKQYVIPASTPAPPGR